MKKRLLKYFVEASGKAADQMSSFAESLAPIAAIAAGYLRTLVQLALIVLLIPIPLLIVGIVLNTGWLVSIIGVFWGLATIMLLVSAAPLGVLLEVVLKSREGSGKRYVKMALSVLLIELTFTLFVAIVPIGNNWRAVPIVLLASAILGILAAQGMRTLFTKKLLGILTSCITSCILIVFVASFAFPKSFTAFQDLFPWVDKQLAALILPEQLAARRLAEARREAERKEAAREETLQQAVNHDLPRLHATVIALSQKAGGVAVTPEMLQVASRYRREVTLAMSVRRSQEKFDETLAPAAR